MTRPRIATCSLAGCFGCHMSILDIDDRILQLAEKVDFDRSPINDIKTFTGPCTVGLVEGACANEENVEVLRTFRRHCEVLVAVGECAVTGGVPAMRNGIPLQECLDEAYRNGPTVHNPENVLPSHPDVPRLLDRIYPVGEVVEIDHYMPGCPPSADAIWETLTALLEGRKPALAYGLTTYD